MSDSNHPSSLTPTAFPERIFKPKKWLYFLICLPIAFLLVGVLSGLLHSPMSYNNIGQIGLLILSTVFLLILLQPSIGVIKIDEAGIVFYGNGSEKRIFWYEIKSFFLFEPAQGVQQIRCSLLSEKTITITAYAYEISHGELVDLFHAYQRHFHPESRHIPAEGYGKTGDPYWDFIKTQTIVIISILVIAGTVAGGLIWLAKYSRGEL